jgi:hypothetical protein
MKIFGIKARTVAMMTETNFFVVSLWITLNSFGVQIIQFIVYRRLVNRSQSLVFSTCVVLRHLLGGENKSCLLGQRHNLVGRLLPSMFLIYF